MKIQVDDLVRNAVDNSRVYRKTISDSMHISREWLRKMLNDPQMEVKNILAIGKAINYDFSVHFPELQRTNGVGFNEPSSDYFAEDFKGQLFELQKKYIELQAKYINLLEDLRTRSDNSEKNN